MTLGTSSRLNPIITKTILIVQAVISPWVREPCPNQTFILPENAELIINDPFYRVGEFRLNHQEVIDPLFTLRANWYLQPKIHRKYRAKPPKGKNVSLLKCNKQNVWSL
jgi:hypothetical protein